MPAEVLRGRGRVRGKGNSAVGMPAAETGNLCAGDGQNDAALPPWLPLPAVEVTEVTPDMVHSMVLL